MESLRQLGESLRAQRKKLHLTQAAMARRAGIALRTYVRLEAGDAGAALGTYAQAAQSLGLELRLVSRARPTLEELEAIYGDD